MGFSGMWKMNKEIVVIGGGAAGMMAAIAAAEQGATVRLLEPNERLGKKLNITGKGRCNVTNNCTPEELMAHIARNGKFLYSALNRFTSADAMAFFEGIGVPLKTERGNRVFPVSDCAFDVSGALRRRMEKLGVRWEHDRAVSVRCREGTVCSVSGEKADYPARAVILATGGVSYPGTGSTGDGYRMARELGHTIVEPHGSLVPLVSDDPCCGRMQGLALKNVQLSARNEKGKTVFSEFGEMLYTHFGVSGPLVLSASAHLREWDEHRYILSVDLKPALTEEKLEERLLRELREQSNRNMENVLASLLPHSMIPVMCERLGIGPDLKANSLKKEQRRALEHELKHFDISVTGPRPVAEAIVTSGGVKVGEVNPNSMESKKVRGLFFAGEILDVDAYTGGFNLQIAWSTGRAAGLAAAEKEGEEEI